jgi:hypothetical protein
VSGTVCKRKNFETDCLYNKNQLKSIVYPKMLYTGNFSQFGIFSYSWGKLYRREILLKNQLRVTEDITIGEDALCLYPTLLDANILNKPIFMIFRINLNYVCINSVNYF